MSLIDWIRTWQIWDRGRYRAFRIAGQAVGWVREDFAERLREFPKLFRISAAAVDLDPGLTGFEQRSQAVAEALLALKEQGLVPGWRNEPYPVGSDFYASPLMQ